MKRIKLIISYAGTNYVGWQRQQNGLSIQQILEEKIENILNEKVGCIASGRTDAGVHALGQTVHFDCTKPIPLEGLIKVLNSSLPDDISIVDAINVSGDFHAKNSTRKKTYRYLIYESEFKSPLLDKRAWHVKGNLNIRSMKNAAKYLKGKHDYECFRAAGCGAKDAIRKIEKIKFSEVKSSLFFNTGKIYYIEFTGDGFVRHMIRNIVGTLVEIGKGRFDAKDVREMLNSRDRSKAGICAPACGLYLAKVYY